jgi:hypothetical protein
LEIADFIGIDPGLEPSVHLVHCKRSHGTSPAARLQDVEELVAQGMRSTQWLVAGPTLWAEVGRRLTHRAATVAIAGNSTEIQAVLEDWSATPPLVRWFIWLVQPGLSAAVIDTPGSVTSLLSAAHSWIQTQDCELRIVCAD